MTEPSWRAREGVRLAYRLTPGGDPALVFLPGFMSDMTGEKATRTAALAETLGLACLRLDYSGHGQSQGRFEDGTIGRWLDDALFLIESAMPERKLVLVGSSMGGWIALLAALRLGTQVAGLVGIAAAPDFTETLMWDAMAPAERETLRDHGVLRTPSPYGGEQIITRELIEEGRRHLILGGEIALRCPVRLLHGMRDDDVPWETALRLAGRLASDDVRLHLVKDGDHRLSRAADLHLLETVLRDLVAPA